MNVIGRIGAWFLDAWQESRYLAAVAWVFVRTLCLPRYWRAPVREQLVRQLHTVGVKSVGLVAFVAFLVGFAVVAQALIWSRKLAQSQSLVPLLVMVLVGEVVPVVTNLLAIGRSTTHFTGGLGNMKFSGEVKVLESQGIDPLIYLVRPRVVALMVSVFCLSVVFALCAFVSGYLCGFVLDGNVGPFLVFLHRIPASLNAGDILTFTAKAFVPAFFIGIIACTEGLKVEHRASEIPEAMLRSQTRSVVVLLVCSGLISLFTYY